MITVSAEPNVTGKYNVIGILEGGGVLGASLTLEELRELEAETARAIDIIKKEAGIE